MTPTPRPSVAFVTTADVSVLHDDVDLPSQIDAFASAEIELVHAAWEDDAVDWESFDLVVLRSAWNYVDRLADFRVWLHARGALSTLRNPATIIEWNLDKRYLAELAARGVPVVPTRYASTADELDEAIAGLDAAQIIVKPTISAGSRLTGRFDRGSSAAPDLGRRILDAGFAVMIQPFASSVDLVGEVGTVCFDGTISHSFRKGSLLGPEGALRGGEYREEIEPAALDLEQRRLVLDAQAAVHAIAGERGWIAPEEQLLYGRYDIVVLDDGTPALLEAELFEPCFFLPVDAAAVDRFVAAVRSRISAHPNEVTRGDET